MSWKLVLIVLAGLASLCGRSVTAVLRDGKSVQGEFESLDQVQLKLLNQAPIERPRVSGIAFDGVASPGAGERDVVVLRNGKQSTGYVMFADGNEIRQPGTQARTAEVKWIWLAPAKAGAWAVRVSKSGGFAGVHPLIPEEGTHGYGSIAERAKAEPGLSTTHLVKIEEAIRKADYRHWKSSYVPAGDSGCCDRFHMSLTLQVMGRDGKWFLYETRWYSGNQVPGDLQRVYEAASGR